MIRSVGVEKATLYEKYRLPYATELVDGLYEHTGEVAVAADIGAGTGQLTRLFAHRCAKVYAVEPDPAMRQVATAACADLSTVEIVADFAEETTLAEDSVDLVMVGNAFHRFKPAACLELRRILTKQGWIALVTYEFPNEAFTETLFSKLATLRGLSTRKEKTWHRIPVQALFGDAQLRTLSYRQSHSEDWTAFFGAACAGIEAPDRNDEEFEAFEAINREVFEAFAVDDEIQIDYETRVTFGQPS
jgi:SAM-dependent methyltransferase